MASTSQPPAAVSSSTNRTSIEPSRNSLSCDSDPGAAAATPHSLSRAVYARNAEYVRPHRMRVKIGTWNVAACPGTDKDLASWFVEGKGIDQRLAGLDLSHNPAVDTTPDPSPDAQGDPNAVRLVGGDKIGLYVLGLQEVIDLNLARTSLFTDTATMEKWKSALSEALPEGYELVVAEQLSGMLMLIYASHEVAGSIDNVSSTTVGTGLWGYMGNKGGVATRLVLGETTRMVFVNSHLASGSETPYMDRRCWDYGQILSRTQFAPVVHAGIVEDESEKIGDEDFGFWLGDLNFRLDGIPGDDIRHILGLHTRGEYDITKATNGTLDGEPVFITASDSEEEEEEDNKGTPTADPAGSDTATSTSTKEAVMTPDDTSDTLPDPEDFPPADDPEDFRPDPSQDPASLQATIDSLLPHDQLRRVIRERKAFHEGWREGPITFLPTYKYDIGAVGLFDSSEKRRAPSWCDRILFRTRKEKQEYDQKMEEEAEARKKDEEMKARGIDKAGDDDEVLFDCDPESDRDSSSRDASVFDYGYDDQADGTYDLEAEDVVTKDGFHDRIHLDIYTSHQRVTSSDHKPIISIFTLDYDGVVPELKAKVHAEVARELDRAENEGRPGITIIVDGQLSTSDEGVDFGDVGYMRKVNRTLTIANTGRVPAVFSFVEKPTIREDDAEECTPWLTTGFARLDNSEIGDEPIDIGKEVTLEPGDTLSGILDIHVATVSQLLALNSGTAKLEDVLVLRVESGRDHFIPVRGTWLPTCLGRSIDELIRIPGTGGIREFAEERPEIATSAIPYSLDVHTSHPRELFRLIEAIESLTDRVIADENMLEGCSVPRSKPGWPFDPSVWTDSEADSRTPSLRADLIDDLDKGGSSLLDVFPPEMPSPVRLEITCSILRLFLVSLTDGIITPSLWARIDTTLPMLVAPNRSPDENEDDKAGILDILASAPNHNISFVFLTAMLGKVVSELAPLSKETARAFSLQRKAGTSSIGARRSLSFRRTSGMSNVAPEEVRRRMAMEDAVARAVGPWVCRCSGNMGAAGGFAGLGGLSARERRAADDKMSKVVEVFFARV
ncbi:type ii inositol- -trisphosphate 5-phosphatase [Zalerion maritima]|uniref:Type ii inositol- -trisphosphate 5-phosphatase n=1 Tax=Zalerion maritima TaxID=339359 RepID=A0AAD5WUT7_9PEZI|nr:type ii inositol- -trisphosphate 5-phosphatase [Zalerion maritima]